MKIKNLSTSLSTAILLGMSQQVGAVTPVQLTDNIYEDANPRIYHEHVVWNSWDGNDWEIFYRNLITGVTRQITNNDSDDVMPDTDGTRIAWLVETENMLPLVQIYDLALDVSYGFDQYTYFMRNNIDYLIEASMPVAAPRIRDDKLLFGVGGNVWVAGYADEEPDPNVQLLGEYLGSGRASGDAYEFDYKFLEDGTVCWNGSSGRGIDLRYLLSYTSYQGEAKYKFVVQEDVDYPVLYTYHASVLTQPIAGYPQFEEVLGFEVINTTPSFNCSDMEDGKLSITKQYDGVDYDLFWSYEGQEALPVTQDSTDDTYARLSGNRMVWVKGDGANAEIYVAEISDGDGDQVPDEFDNCPTVANPGQEDNNGNGIGDACDAPAASHFSYMVDVTSEWSDGYCGDLYAVNNGSTTVPHPYGVNFTVPAGDVFTSTWTGDIERNGDNATVIFSEWSENMAPGSQSSDPFGFCIRSSSEFTNYSDYIPDFSDVSVSFNIYSTWSTGYCGKFAFTYNGSEAFIPHPDGMTFSLAESTAINSAWGYLDYSRTATDVSVINGVEPHLEPGVSNNAFGFCSNGTDIPTNIVIQP